MVVYIGSHTPRLNKCKGQLACLIWETGSLMLHYSTPFYVEFMCTSSIPISWEYMSQSLSVCKLNLCMVFPKERFYQVWLLKFSATVQQLQQSWYSQQHNTSHSTNKGILVYLHDNIATFFTWTLTSRDTLVLFLINHLALGTFTTSHTLCSADGGGVGAVGGTGRATAGEELAFNWTLCNAANKGEVYLQSWESMSYT